MLALGVLNNKENQSHDLLDPLEKGSAAAVASVVVRGCVLLAVSEIDQVELEMNPSVINNGPNGMAYLRKGKLIDVGY